MTHGLIQCNTRIFVALTLVGLILVAAMPGVVRAQAPVIDVWYGHDQHAGQIGITQPWVNILGNVSDADGIASLVYSLNGAPDVSLTVGPDGRRLASAGDFNVDLATSDLIVGVNQVIITAVDGAANETADTVTVTYAAGNEWPLPYSVNWGATAEIEDGGQVVDGLWALMPDSTVRTVEPGYDRLVAMGDTIWTDYEVTVPVTLHSKPSGFGTGILLRWNGHTDNPIAGTQPKSGYLPLGCIAWHRANRLELYGNGADILATTNRTLTVDVTYMFKARVETISGVGAQYSMKVWEAGQPEPPGWDITGQEQLSDPQYGSMMLISHQADASFGAVTVEPVPVTLSNIHVTVGGGGTEATVNWTTNEPATSSVSYGLTAGYEIGTVSDSALVINHSVPLFGLTPDTLYHYQVTSADSLGNPATTADRTFSTTPSGLVSDDFSSPLLNAALWTFVNPLTDGSYALTGTGSSDAWLNISVPAGVEHQVWSSGIQVPYVVQTANDTDFEVEVKFESTVDLQYQEQGILVRQDSGDYMRFEFFSSTTQTMLFVATFESQVPTTRLNASFDNTGVAPLYMRVRRQGDEWTQTYSYDGTTWLNGVIFTHAINVAEVGMYAGNALGGGSPAHTASFDYFFDTSSPVDPEDPVSPWAISNIIATPGATSAIITWNTDVPTTSSVQYGITPGYEIGTVSDSAYVTAHSITLMGLAPLTTYHFQVTSTDSSMFSLSSGDGTFAIGGNASGIVSDDFNHSVLDTSVWTFVDPLGDATLTTTGYLTEDAWANISVPAGSSHEIFTAGIQAPHLLQSANDTDFEIEVKFDSPVTAQYQEQGVVIKEDDAHYMRFEFFSTSSATVLYARGFTASTSPTYVNTVIGTNGTGPLYMRIRRVGNSWTQSYSFDGQAWTARPAFNHTLAVTGVGPYSGNASGGTSPAHTTSVDYFFDTSSPIDPEDGNEVVPVYMTSFTAERGDGQRGVLRWLVSHVSEDHMGFDVYRATGDDTPRRITSEHLTGSVSYDEVAYEYVDVSAPTEPARYWLQELTRGGETYWYGPALLPRAVRIAKFALEPNYPNPFNPTTTIRYETASAGLVSLRIFDVHGRLVRTLVNDVKESGQYSETWHGLDDNGAPVSSGVYFVRLQSGKKMEARKIVLLK